jgi:hypothetical protein
MLQFLLGHSLAAQFMAFGVDLQVQVHETEQDVFVLLMDQPDELVYQAFERAANLSTSERVVFCYVSNGMRGFEQLKTQIQWRPRDGNLAILLGFKSFLTYLYDGDLLDSGRIVGWI